jgi:transposase
LEERVPAEHPLRPIGALADEALAALDDRFAELYSWTGRPSIPPEMLLRAALLQAFFSVRSERLLMEQIDCNLLFRWFVGLPMDAPVWHPTVFTHNRDRLLETDVAREFLAALLTLPKVNGLLSDDHFSVDGMLIDAWASTKSFRPKDGPGDPPDPGRNGERNFREEKRSNETHASATDPDARPYRKGSGRENRLCFMGHLLMENRNGIAVDTALTHAAGTAEREAALAMLDQRPGHKRRRRITPGADMAYDVAGFVEQLRARCVTPHIAVDGRVSGLGKVRKSAVDGRTTRYAGYAISQRIRKRSRSRSAGSKPLPASVRSRSEALPKWKRCSLSRSPPTTWSEYPGYWSKRQHDRPDKLPTDRTVARRRGRSVGSRSSRPRRASHAAHSGDGHGEIAFGAMQAGS